MERTGQGIIGAGDHGASTPRPAGVVPPATDHLGEVGAVTGVVTEAVGGAIGLVVAAMLIGVVDILRKPNWAWKAAGEPGCCACCS